MRIKWKLAALTCNLFLLCSLSAIASVATFDDLSLAPESYWNGSDGSGGFTSGNVFFPNAYDPSWGSWSGFSYSNMTDTTTRGYTNQYSAITGKGVNGSANYGVSYHMLDWMNGTYETIPNVVSLIGDNYNTTISGLYVTNTTYAYYSMLEGDSFSKKFGGDTGDDPDWFMLSIKGIGENGGYTGEVNFYLADYRFDDNSLDYIVNEWTWVDLTSLGNVVGLKFSLMSSDVGPYGMNTPAYFALDDLNGNAPVPIPGAVWLLGAGLVGVWGIRTRMAES